LDPFLPEDERDRRRKSARQVKWAINVSIAMWLSEAFLS